MRRTVLLFAVALSIIIRLLLLVQQPGLSFEAYHTLREVEHIRDTGMPLSEDLLGWGGSTDVQLPVFYYFLSLVSLILPTNIVVVLIPALFLSLLPIPIQLLTQELTRHDKATVAITIASAFVPLLYTNTNTGSPLTLAIPLLLMCFYYFIRLARTPKDQYVFLILTIALILTHPISLLLVAAMVLTLIFTSIQKLRFYKSLVEATLFTALSTVWVLVILYKQPLLTFGVSLFTFAERTMLTFPEIATLVGVLPLLAGAFASYHYITDEKNLTAHALTALVVATALALVFRMVPTEIGLLIIGAALIALSGGAIEELIVMMRRARYPWIYTIGFVVLAVLFVLTSGITALTVGATSLQNIPSQEDIAVIAALQETYPAGERVLWKQEAGFMLEHAGFESVWNTHIRSHEDTQSIMETVELLPTHTREIPYLSALNALGTTILVDPETQVSLSERCFPSILPGVYEVQCVVQ